MNNDKAKWEAIGLIGDRAVYSLYENVLTVISQQELETLRKNRAFTQELLQAGFTEEELVEEEREIRKLIRSKPKEDSQIIKAMKEILELPERRER